MICMMIPANALIYGTFLNVSLASFAIFNTVSTAFVAVDSMYSRLVVGGTSGIPWVTIVFLCSRVCVDCPCASNGWSRVFEPITKYVIVLSGNEFSCRAASLLRCEYNYSFLSTAKYSQETCSQARVRLHSGAITLDTQGAFASDSLVFRFLPSGC